MYRKFFGLKESPFSVSPDPRYLYWTKTAQESLSALAYGIQSRKGFIMLTGEVGTGKTTLLYCLLDWLRKQQIATAFVFNSQLLSVTQLFDFIMTDFGIPCESRMKSQVLLKLNNWLLDRYRAGRTSVLIIDEAQNLSDEVLEEVRLLTNLETSSEKLLQVVLSGQPEFDDKLKRPQLRQLRQRVVFRCKTVPLTKEETHSYIRERLKIAGNIGQFPFSKETIEAIYRYSQGIPRVINLLCEHSLINAFVGGVNPVPSAVVEEIAREFQLDEITPIPPPDFWSNHEEKQPAERVEGLLRDLFSYLRPVDQPRELVSRVRERKT